MYTGWAGQLAGMRKMQCFWNKNTKETNVVAVKEQTTESNNEDLETQKEMEINWPIDQFDFRNSSPLLIDN